MLSFDYYDNSARLKNLHKRVSDLTCHPFLYLRPAGVHVHQPCQLGQPGDLALLVRYVPQVRETEERRQMMLAGREHLDAANQHHLVVIGIEHGGEHVAGLEAEAGELLRVGPGDPVRRFPQPVPVRVLADGEQDLADRPLDPLGGPFGPDARGRGSSGWPLSGPFGSGTRDPGSPDGGPHGSSH